MRRITTWALSTLSALVLLFSYHTSTSSAGSTSVAAGIEGANGTTDGSSGDTSADATTTPDPTPSDSPSSEASPTPSPSSSSDSSSSDSGSTSSGTTTSGTTTVSGDAIQTRYGPVQVEITVTDGKITKSVVTQVPWNDHRDQEINSYAVPILNQEAVAAQSADIDMVSGATYTSDGYRQSLQSALDQANL